MSINDFVMPSRGLYGVNNFKHKVSDTWKTIDFKTMRMVVEEEVEQIMKRTITINEYGIDVEGNKRNFKCLDTILKQLNIKQ